ncbi:MAG: hypothetical protein HFI22_06805 [Lachnospiraceae bacterium]|nr:hypothetical protein [Lachnospiraceae bacterium]
MRYNSIGKKGRHMQRSRLLSGIMLAVFLILLSCFASGCFLAPKARFLSMGGEGMNSPYYKKKQEWNGDYLWYGGIKWRILEKYFNIFLLADHIPEEYLEEWDAMSYETRKPEDVEGNPGWETSPIREYLNTSFYAAAFTPEERDAMVYAFEYDAWTPSQDKIFLLRWRDVIDNSYGFTEKDYVQRAYDKDWWLLPEGDSLYVYVASGGLVMEVRDEMKEYLEKALRPAFYVDPDCIVFLRDVSSAWDFEPSPVLLDTRMESERTGEWVPVLSSEAQHVEIGTVELEGDVCTISYHNASVGVNQYLSAVVTDREKTVRYYGRLAQINSQSEGTVTVQLPDSYKKSWSLQIFSERPEEGTKTSYASEPVVVLEGRAPVMEPLVSEGRCDPEQEPEPLNMIISRGYDPFLDWYAEDYENASEEEKHYAGTAALLYTALCQEDSGLLIEDRYTRDEIRQGADYADEHPEDTRAMADVYFASADAYGLSLKETMDRLFGRQIPDAYEGEADLFEYTKYLDYTGAMYLDASDEEQDNILIASWLYLEKYRLEQEVSQEYAQQVADFVRNPEAYSEETGTYIEALRLFLEKSSEEYPDAEIQDLMNYMPN